MWLQACYIPHYTSMAGIWSSDELYSTENCLIINVKFKYPNLFIRLKMYLNRINEIIGVLAPNLFPRTILASNVLKIDPIS